MVFLWIVVVVASICGYVAEGGYIIRKKHNNLNNHNQEKGHILNYNERNHYVRDKMHPNGIINNNNHYMGHMPRYYSGMHEMKDLLESDDDSYSNEDDHDVPSSLCFVYSEIDLSNVSDHPLQMAEVVLFILAVCGCVMICIAICVIGKENMEQSHFGGVMGCCSCLLIIALIIIMIVDCVESL
eukprot:322741_1